MIARAKYLYSLLLVISLLPSKVHSRETSTYLNPGLRLGYVFGENGGFTSGIEISYTWVNTKQA